MRKCECSEKLWGWNENSDWEWKSERTRGSHWDWKPQTTLSFRITTEKKNQLQFKFDFKTTVKLRQISPNLFFLPPPPKRQSHRCKRWFIVYVMECNTLSFLLLNLNVTYTHKQTRPKLDELEFSQQQQPDCVNVCSKKIYLGVCSLYDECQPSENEKSARVGER